MNFLEIPVAKTPDEITDGVESVARLDIPGFLIAPEASSEVIGQDIVALALSIDSSDGQNTVNQPLLGILNPLLHGYLGIDLINPDFWAIQFYAAGGRDSQSHTDHRPAYYGPAAHLSGPLEEGYRTVELATVCSNIDHSPLPLAETVPFSTEKVFKGRTYTGWITYFLSKQEKGTHPGNKMTAHKYDLAGEYARFGYKE